VKKTRCKEAARYREYITDCKAREGCAPTGCTLLAHALLVAHHSVRIITELDVTPLRSALRESFVLAEKKNSAQVSSQC